MSHFRHKGRKNDEEVPFSVDRKGSVRLCNCFFVTLVIALVPIRKPCILNGVGTHYMGKSAIHCTGMPVASWVSVGITILSQFNTQLSSRIMLLLVRSRGLRPMPA
jgi:hypothetical protein